MQQLNQNNDKSKPKLASVPSNTPPEAEDLASACETWLRGCGRFREEFIGEDNRITLSVKIKSPKRTAGGNMSLWAQFPRNADAMRRAALIEMAQTLKDFAENWV